MRRTSDDLCEEYELQTLEKKASIKIFLINMLEVANI